MKGVCLFVLSRNCLMSCRTPSRSRKESSKGRTAMDFAKAADMCGSHQQAQGRRSGGALRKRGIGAESCGKSCGKISCARDWLRGEDVPVCWCEKSLGLFWIHRPPTHGEETKFADGCLDLLTEQL